MPRRTVRRESLKSRTRRKLQREIVNQLPSPLLF